MLKTPNTERRTLCSEPRTLSILFKTGKSDPLKPKSTSNLHAYAVILAGGRGERFWPMSTARRPKQLLALTSGRPMLAEAVRRLQPLIPPERVIIVTNAELTPAIREIMPDFPARNIIGEPEARNTAPAVALGAAIVRARAPSAQMAVLTADHIIGDLPVFRQTLADALALAAARDVLLTIGIPPAAPSTGFGYLEAAPDRLADPALGKGVKTEFYRVARFVEKPDRTKAKRYVQAGNFYWNAGMFIWSLAAFENAARRHHPELAELMDALAPAVDRPGFAAALAQAYPRLQKISIDYALMEKAGNIAMARGKFQWDDVGSWASLEKHFKRDAAGNVSVGRTVVLDAAHNVVMAGEKNLIALIGVENLVVVQHNHATLVCPKGRDQDVKKIVEQLKRRADCRGWL